MTARVLTGTKQEIARQVAGLDGDVRQAIVLIADTDTDTDAHPAAAGDDDDVFAEMDAFVARPGVGPVDDSRAAIYRRAGGE